MPRDGPEGEEGGSGGEVRGLHKFQRQYRWRLKSSNGQVIATSGEGYITNDSALNGIDAVKRDAGAARTEDLT